MNRDAVLPESVAVPLLFPVYELPVSVYIAGFVL